MEKDNAPHSEPDHSALKEFLLEHVRNHYAQSAENLLLANLGWALNNERPELRQHLGRQTVGQFIRREMADRLEVPPNPINPTAPYVFLRGHPPRTEAAVPASSASTGVLANRRKYAHAVFLAFTRPLISGFKRYLVLSGALHFRDIAAGGEAPPDSRPVDAAFIVPPVAGQSRAEVQESLNTRIDRWLEQHKLPLDLVLEQPKSASGSAKTESLFDLLLATLSEPERKRIQLPLDIVAKLQNTPK